MHAKLLTFNAPAPHFQFISIKTALLWLALDIANVVFIGTAEMRRPLSSIYINCLSHTVLELTFENGPPKSDVDLLLRISMRPQTQTIHHFGAEGGQSG